MEIWKNEDGSFKELSKTEAEALKHDEMALYLVAKSENAQAELEARVKELEADKSKEEEASKLRKEFEAMKKDNELQELRIKGILEGVNGVRDEKTVKAQISNFIEENHDKIKAIKNAGHGLIEMTVKVVGDMTTGSASNPDGIPELQGTQAAPAGNVNLRGSIVDSLVTTFQTDQASYAYTETVPKDGDYSFVAEGGTKPQIDFAIETRYAEPKKVAAHMILTEESVKDIRGLQNIATNYLRAKHDLKRQNGILFGDGLGANPTGATTYGRTFVAGSMALAVTNPNFMDVVNACVTDIYTTHNYTDEMPYMANIVMVNPVDFYLQLVSAKDGQGLPLYPQAGLFNRVSIGSVTIIPFEDIPAGKIFVADLSKYKITNYVPYTVRIGWINDQFITNKFTMVGESRLHAFVEKLDEQAFIYDDIATVKTAITAP